VVLNVVDWLEESLRKNNIVNFGCGKRVRLCQIWRYIVSYKMGWISGKARRPCGWTRETFWPGNTCRR